MMAFKDRRKTLSDKVLTIFVVSLISNIKVSEGEFPSEVAVGGLFETKYEDHRLAFEYAIKDVNRRTDILPHTKLVPVIDHVPPHDSYTTSVKVCQLVQQNVAAIFGPLSSLASEQVQSVCDLKEIPHIETHVRRRHDKASYSINIHPDSSSYGEFLFDVIKYYGWKTYTILYQSDKGFERFGPLVTRVVHGGVDIKYQKLIADNGDYSLILKRLMKLQYQRLVIDCDIETVPLILRQMSDLKMMTEYYHIIFTTMDIDITMLNPYLETGTNITTFRLVDLDNPLTVSVLHDWRQASKKKSQPFLSKDSSIATDLTLIYDGVLLLAQTLDTLSLTKHSNFSTSKMSCFDDVIWSHGHSLLNYMQTTTFNGLTGKVQFDARGDRTIFNLDIVEMASHGFEKTGTWNPETGVNFTRNYSQVIHRVIDVLSNKTFRVTTVLEKPFTMIKKPDKNGYLPSGNDRFEGFCIDMLKELAKKLNFTYEIHLVKDGQYGAPYKDRPGWNGMVGELLRKEADVAVAPLTISLIREEVIDFTAPFMTTGISIVLKRPLRAAPGLFSFLFPLSAGIWMYVVVAYVVVSFLIFVLARFSPYEWYNPHPCNPDSDVVENQFNLSNSLWFTIGSLMQQGSDFAPRALSTRLVSGTWWFFTLLLIASYTANLAAFLTVQRMKAPIENAEDLSKQERIKYGTRWSGASMSFFKKSKIPTYQRMWQFMSTEEPTVFVNSSEEGLKRVLRPEGQDYDYAFLMESAYRDYAITENCDLMGIGGLLDNKGYGIGVPWGSPYADVLSNMVLKLQEEQIIELLVRKWWKPNKTCEAIDSKDNSGSSERLDLHNVGGVFVVLLGGLAFSVIVAFIEFIVNARQNADEDKQSLWSEMLEELRFAVRCMGSTKKPVKKKKRISNLVDNGMTLIPLTASAGLHTKIPGKDIIS